MFDGRQIWIFMCNFHDFCLVLIGLKLDIQWNILMNIDPVALGEGSASVFGDRKAASLYSKLLCQAHWWPRLGFLIFCFFSMMGVTCFYFWFILFSISIIIYYTHGHARSLLVRFERQCDGIRSHGLFYLISVIIFYFGQHL